MPICNIMKEFLLLFILLVLSQGYQSDVGYRVGNVDSYRLIRNTSKSALYEVVAKELDDGRPMKLINLYGNAYEVGFDYGYLLADEIYESYHTFVSAQISNELELKIVESFLDFQYEVYVKKQLPLEFLDEIRGIHFGGAKKGHKMLNVYIERVLVISSFPGDIGNDIITVLIDEMMRFLRIKNPRIEKQIQNSIYLVKETIKKFIKKHAMHCSFFGVWGKRTNNRLFTMRNLDWETNTGVNKNKLITVYHIDGKIPHLTLGYPGVVGALTGMSAAGITVHEAGLSSIHESEVGFQWALRLRYIMMNANNLAESLNIWKKTNNTLGMNFMIGSGNDGKAVALQTMRAYTAFFYDGDSRQNGTTFTDHKGNKYRSGFSMKQTVFRTNHAYDPTINKGRPDHRQDESDDSMIRYFILKNGFNWYNESSIVMGEVEALNMTAILGDKGSEKFMSCKNNNRGLNTISVLYEPKVLKMWVAFQYGFKQTFRSACCGVYLYMDMTRWLNAKVDPSLE